MRSDARTAAPDGRVRKSFRPLLPQPIADARRNLHFFTRVSFLFASYKSFQVQTLALARVTRADQAAIDAAWSKQHDWGGRALYRLACDLKGYHLKGCQWLGSRPDIAPPEFVLHLSKLQDRCPPLALTEVEAVIASETGLRLAEAFSEFDEEPLGSASIAQVPNPNPNPNPNPKLALILTLALTLPRCTPRVSLLRAGCGVARGWRSRCSGLARGT